MDIASEVKRLSTRRELLARELEDIDSQMEIIRAALGFAAKPFVSTATRSTKDVIVAREEAIISALAQHEPQRVSQLARTANIKETNLRPMVARMTSAGRLFRRADVRGSRGSQGGGWWYARSETAFAGHPDTDPSNKELTEEAVDELG